MSFGRILVPVDYSPNSLRALDAALSLSDAVVVDVVHIWDRPSYVTEELTVAHADGSRRSLSDLILENAEREMTEFLKEVKVPAGKRLEHHLSAGEPVTALLERVTKGSYDLLVVGTHGRSGVSRFLLGSVTEKLIRLAPVPVLVVPPLRD